MSLTAAEVLERLDAWAQDQPNVRAMLLTSTRASPHLAVDALSDYDILLILADVQAFAQSDAWRPDFGPVLTRLNQRFKYADFDGYTRLVLHKNGVRIDYALQSAANFAATTAGPALPEHLRIGYRVLLDKDGLAAHLPPPDYQAFIPAPPSAAEFQELVELFWWETTYVAKNLRRGELFFARYNYDCMLVQQHLLRLLEWRTGLLYAWRRPVGVHGRYLPRNLPPELWQEVAGLFAGGDIAAHWQALWRLCAVFRANARQVAAALGYTYPQELDEEVSRYLRTVQAIEL